MSNSETKIEDAQGKFMRVVESGQEMTDASWQQCRAVLTSQRLILLADGKLAIPLESIDRMGERYDVNQRATAESSYSTLYVGDDVVLLSVGDQDSFETNLYRAILDNAVVLVQHPAVEGGVVQNASWQDGRLTVTEETVRVILESGQQFVIDRDDIGEFDTDERTVDGETVAVIEVEHSDDAGTSVETHLSGQDHQITVLQQLLEEGAERNRADLDLDPVERRVVMALYSGVSPFEIAEFVGTDVETVEEIYDTLVELDVVEVVRERTEVGLTAQGRKIAGEAMGER